MALLTARRSHSNGSGGVAHPHLKHAAGLDLVDACTDSVLVEPLDRFSSRLATHAGAREERRHLATVSILIDLQSMAPSPPFSFPETRRPAVAFRRE
jgi:hypothetical protein